MNANTMNQKELDDWETRTGRLTINDLLQLALYSEIRIYEDDLPEGAILDIGPGLGCEAIYFSEKGRTVYVVDKEDYFLNRINDATKNKIVTIRSKMPHGDLPDAKFALVILSNILHFLSFDESILVCKKISSLINSECYVLIRVHSKKHPYAQINHEKNTKFKHFFTAKEVKELFSPKNYEHLFFSNYRRKFNKTERVIMGNNLKSFKDGYIMIVKKK